MFYVIYPELWKLLKKMKILSLASEEAAAPLMSVAAPLWFWKFLKKNSEFGIFFSKILKRGSPLYKLFGAGWGQKGVGGFFFKNPTTQLRAVWGLTEKKCEQTPKFACFSV